MKVDVKVQGLNQLAKRISQLDNRVSGRIGRKATAAGARIIRDEAKSNVPVDTGQLKDNIVVKKLRGPKGKFNYGVGLIAKEYKRTNNKTNRRKGIVGQSYWRNNAYYGYMVEFGTVKMQAQPFLRPAFEAKKTAAAERIEDVLKTEIDKIG